LLKNTRLLVETLRFTVIVSGQLQGTLQQAHHEGEKKDKAHNNISYTELVYSRLND
jgi:hypothetical protein